MLKCIFYSEFDNIAGPRIFYQHPNGYLRLFCNCFIDGLHWNSFIPNDVFDGVSEYIIPKSSLCGRLISLYVHIYLLTSNNINYTLVIIYGLILDDLSIIIPKFTSQINCWFRVAFGNKILGYPVLIDDVKYHRNALLFNVCLVFDPDTDTQSYEPIVRKLSYLFRNLEVISPPQVWCKGKVY